VQVVDEVVLYQRHLEQFGGFAALEERTEIFFIEAEAAIFGIDHFYFFRLLNKLPQGNQVRDLA
jgi:hypothetical protein